MVAGWWCRSAVPTSGRVGRRWVDAAAVPATILRRTGVKRPLILWSVESLFRAI